LNFLDFSPEKYSNIKFHKNLSSWGRVIPCGQTDMANLIVAFRNSANTAKMNDLNCGMSSEEEHSVFFKCLLNGGKESAGGGAENEYNLTNSTYARTKERVFVITAEDVIKHFLRPFSKNHW
jgi:hypothetical protein